MNGQLDGGDHYNTIEPKQYLSLTALGHSIFTFNYERSIIEVKNFSVLGEIGLGIGEFSESEPPNESPAVYALNTWLPLQYSFGVADVIAVVSPTLYQYGNLGFIDVNGVLGVRVNFAKNKSNSGVFCALYYNNKIYRTVSNPEEIYFFSPISIKFGGWF